VALLPAPISNSFEKIWVYYALNKHTLERHGKYINKFALSFVEPSVELKEELSKRHLLVATGWMPPMSYRQFNMLLQKSKLTINSYRRTV
jgi:hypothetical protein